ncbi:LOW QUALITY PROTEIN: avidin-like [Strix aluco]|uniref:LOW QUALITY PROTEIN: avidin-like n=1 Tax=Strix aluco TaxID=111821 RepID=UPI003DA42831
MVQVTPFLLVLSLALMAHGLPERKCVLTGQWKNDLGSNMTIGELRNFITFNGTYLTAVSMSPKKIPPSPLLGFQQHTDQPTFGFTVKWKSTNTITVFTGQCFLNDDGNEVLDTMWLLRLDADSEKHNWNATLIGINIFTCLHAQKERG